MFRFTTLEDIEEYAAENNLEIDMEMFRQTSIHEHQAESNLNKETNTHFLFDDVNKFMQFLFLLQAYIYIFLF